MIQYQEMNIKEDYLRWQMHYQFRNKLIKESMMGVLRKVEESSAENKQVIHE